MTTTRRNGRITLRLFIAIVMFFGSVQVRALHGRGMLDYIEVQVHGTLDFARDVLIVVVSESDVRLMVMRSRH